MEFRSEIFPSPSQTLAQHKRPRCIVKLGGAAITCKNELEKINLECLGVVCAQLREAMMPETADSMEKILAMDWSRRIGASIDSIPDKFEEDSTLVSDGSFIIVHGAGSFGHFQASRSGVNRGGLHLPFVKAGFVATRISVTSLNIEIVRALAREGITAVGISPFACGWSTQGRNVRCSSKIYCLCGCFSHPWSSLCWICPCFAWGCRDRSFTGMYHTEWRCHYTPSSATPIARLCCISCILYHYATYSSIQLMVYIRVGILIKATDVLGVYDRPPTHPNAILLREIAVDEEGNWSIVTSTLQHVVKQVEITVASHDTTGGMETKILEAAVIARLGVNVYITKAGTEHSLRALKGEITDEWLGTVVRSSSKPSPFSSEP